MNEISKIFPSYVCLQDIISSDFIFVFNMELHVIKAIADVDLNELERLLKISDFLHKGMPSYGGFNRDDMLTDMKYEEALAFLKEQRALEITMNEKTTTEPQFGRKANENTLMYMDGIQIVDTIPTLKDVLLMPKFDGCSVGCEIIKSGEEYILSKAHTRGSDNLNGTRQCQDKTAYLQVITEGMMETINRITSDTKRDLRMNIHYKDTTILGNENKTLRAMIDLHNLEYLLIRGEFVSNNKNNMNNKKLPSTAVGLAAGALNANVDKFNEYKSFIDYIPFEIALIRVISNKELVEYVPTQDSAIKIMRALEMISYKVYKAKIIDNTFDMENALLAFESNTNQPLDGIVYCNRNWTYPVSVEETSKRVNYGKYKWKRHNVKQTKLTDIEYSIGKTGKLTPSFIFNGVEINGKTYVHAKTTFNHIKEFIEECKSKDKAFGKGLVCELELMSDIAPQITRVFPQISHVTEEFIPLVNCPYCGKPLAIEEKKIAKQRVINAICENQKCKGILVGKCCDFLKQIGYKGVSNKTLENMNYKHFSTLYDSKLKKEYKEVGKKEKIIYSAKTVMNQKDKKDFDDIIESITVKNFLISTSLFTKAKVEEFIRSKNANGMDNLIMVLHTDQYKDLLNYLLHETNYFIKDLTIFILRRFCNADNKH